MRKYFLLLIFLLPLTAAVYGQKPAAAFTSVSLQPTVAYIKQNGETRRVARLLFNNGKNYAGGQLYISFNGHQKTISLPENKSGAEYDEVALPGPAIKVATQATVTLKTAGQAYTTRCIIEPARQNWTVYVLPHSHVDIGYTNVQAKVLKLHMENIDESINLAQKTQNYPEEARFKWTTEAIWVVDNYLKLSSPEKQASFWDAVKKGWINLDGAYGNINTSLTDSRQLMQMFAESQRLAKQHSIQINTMFQGDVPGASWGLSAQVEQTGIKYFLSGPNASDRIGNLAKWQDKPFYWVAPSGKQKLLFWQCQPYSIGYALKGTKIPNFFSVEDPKPFYTGKPEENFLNPYLFKYLGDLEQKAFPYDMTILTWAMSDNAPIDPELPDAVKAWNEHYESPKLVITSVKQFFGDFEKKYKDQIPSFAGDYTEYWTDGVSSAAKETAKNRNASDMLKQGDAIWAIRNKTAYPVKDFNETWKNLLLFNEHTWGAYNSTDDPEDKKVLSEWAYKQAFALNAEKKSDSLLNTALTPVEVKANAVDVYNTLSWPRTDVVYLSPELSKAGDLVKDDAGKKVVSQRLSTGQLAFVAEAVPQFGKRTYTVNAGAAYKGTAKSTVNQYMLQSGLYTISINKTTGDIQKLVKAGVNFATDTTGLNHYIYMPGDSLESSQSVADVQISVKENGPLVVSLLVKSAAPGANGLSREVRLVNGLDRVEIINILDKKAIRQKESVHFAFPFSIENAQVRYSIPWGIATAEADQLPYANRNWYTMQRWVDVSNAGRGITWSSPDAPLFEIGKITTANLLGGLHFSPYWVTYTPQSSALYSWVMNNLWHTNFRADQEGPTTFRYYLSAHTGGYDSFAANQTGLNVHQQLIASAASAIQAKGPGFKLDATGVYAEVLKPADDGKGTILMLVNSTDADKEVTISSTTGSAIQIWESNLSEEKKASLNNKFTLAGKGIITLRIENK
ncbi:glycosyl hydrolase-related protein [Mucilaginibacter celer]|uniref:Glycoside hydrolase n=1 Tax=Mucilaginibacter celer TaxID=2305508 RepID=A0A494W711_9SPHI|nr:glycoside hydrolase family 38 C-terminal domain-containing protein [Mucilaginibacter celer]AYL99092.1 glycoside hydrolase [Mucilaginibacter celer]